MTAGDHGSLADGTDTVRAEVIVDAPISRAFEVFTHQAHDWWPEQYRLLSGERFSLAMEPVVGGVWAETSDVDEFQPWGVVAVWEPPRHVGLDWQIGASFDPEPDRASASRLDVHFEDLSDTQTRVTLTHRDLRKHGTGWDRMKASLAGPSGWSWIMQRYAEIVHTAQ